MELGKLQNTQGGSGGMHEKPKSGVSNMN